MMIRGFQGQQTTAAIAAGVDACPAVALSSLRSRLRLPLIGGLLLISP